MNLNKNLLITGGAGFIGSCFVRTAMRAGYNIFILDALTYSGHMANLDDAGDFVFIKDSITNLEGNLEILIKHQIDAVVNFAAESHVDNSIVNPDEFIQTNIVGTYALLQASLRYYNTLEGSKRDGFRYVQISTDEVFGSLDDIGKFTETSRIQPNSPYSASKASADHLARAWFETYKLPVITTHCSNNYGPRQFPEKLIPKVIFNALNNKPLPIYGTGNNVRDWIHVEDHSNGVLLALEHGIPGEVYCFGGNAEHTNLEVVTIICSILDKEAPREDGKSYTKQITFVEDRKGHDYRYAIDDSKARNALNFRRKYDFHSGIVATINWYVDNYQWYNTIVELV